VHFTRNRRPQVDDGAEGVEDERLHLRQLRVGPRSAGAFTISGCSRILMPSPPLPDVPDSSTFVLIMGTTPLTGAGPADAATVLFGSTRRRILGWLLGHPDEAFYLRQIVRNTGAALGAAQRELEQLTGAGLLLRTVQGRQVYFRANQAAPIFPELQGLFAKTAGLTDLLRGALAPLSERVLVAFVFGSAARGELKASSDVDLLVVGDAPFQDVVASLAGAQGPGQAPLPHDRLAGAAYVYHRRRR
jgi:DNA-binding transcriptional ArsR family regulator